MFYNLTCTYMNTYSITIYETSKLEKMSRSRKMHQLIMIYSHSEIWMINKGWPTNEYMQWHRAISQILPWAKKVKERKKVSHEAQGEKKNHFDTILDLINFEETVNRLIKKSTTEFSEVMEMFLMVWVKEMHMCQKNLHV